MWSVPALEVTEAERAELGRRVRAKTSAQREAQRARIVLLAAEGVPNRQIAQQVSMSEEYVGLWRRRFAEKGVEGLKDAKRSGRPRKYGHDERLRVVAAATAERPEFDSEWSHRLLADYLSDLGISASQVGRPGRDCRARGPKVTATATASSSGASAGVAAPSSGHR